MHVLFDITVLNILLGQKAVRNESGPEKKLKHRVMIVMMIEMIKNNIIKYCYKMIKIVHKIKLIDYRSYRHKKDIH